MSYRFVEPGRAILEDLILNRRVRLTDPAAIADAQRSLQRMLSDFIDDTTPGMSKADRAKVVESMDISVVSEQYDKEIRNAVRNVFSGAFLRLGLGLLVLWLSCGFEVMGRLLIGSPFASSHSHLHAQAKSCGCC